MIQQCGKVNSCLSLDCGLRKTQCGRAKTKKESIGRNWNKNRTNSKERKELHTRERPPRQSECWSKKQLVVGVKQTQWVKWFCCCNFIYIFFYVWTWIVALQSTSSAEIRDISNCTNMKCWDLSPHSKTAPAISEEGATEHKYKFGV